MRTRRDSLRGAILVLYLRSNFPMDILCALPGRSPFADFAYSNDVYCARSREIVIREGMVALCIVRVGIRLMLSFQMDSAQVWCIGNE